MKSFNVSPRRVVVTVRSRRYSSFLKGAISPLIFTFKPFGIDGGAAGGCGGCGGGCGGGFGFARRVIFFGSFGGAATLRPRLMAFNGSNRFLPGRLPFSMSRICFGFRPVFSAIRLITRASTSAFVPRFDRG